MNRQSDPPPLGRSCCLLEIHPLWQIDSPSLGRPLDCSFAHRTNFPVRLESIGCLSARIPILAVPASGWAPSLRRSQGLFDS